MVQGVQLVPLFPATLFLDDTAHGAGSRGRGETMWRQQTRALTCPPPLGVKQLWVRAAQAELVRAGRSRW